MHTATVFVGNLGAPGRMKYGVMGDGVNLASRLEELNKRYGTRVLVSDATAAAPGVEREFHLRPVDYVAVKGRAAPVMVHEVVARRAHRQPTSQPQRAEGAGLGPQRRLPQSPAQPSLSSEAERQFELLCKLHRDAMDSYLSRDFASAISLLQRVASLQPCRTDIPALLLKERCEYLVRYPPPPGWDGCEVLTQKSF